MDEQRLGILALGHFVGFLLGFGLMKSQPNLKAALTVVGAALGGAPVLFVGDAVGKWLYPLGLLGGLLWVRVIYARVEIAAKISRPTKKREINGYFAWIDITAVLLLTLIGGCQTCVPSEALGFRQEGHVNLDANGEYEVFYAMPYEVPPNLELDTYTGWAEVQIIEQRPNGFKFKATLDEGHTGQANWEAVGVPKDEPGRIPVPVSDTSDD